MHKLATDNNAFLEFHPNCFFVKDQATRAIIHKGKCEGLSPIRSSSSPSQKHVFGATKPSVEGWHSRLGHPSFSIVDHVLRNNKLPFIKGSSKESICDACQRAKSHQLPYSKSNSVSTYPLELIFSDVWGRAPESVGRHTYYVSFIDDFSKYTWIYLGKSQMFSKSFATSKILLKENSIERFSPCKQIGVVSMKNFILFSNR